MSEQVLLKKLMNLVVGKRLINQMVLQGNLLLLEKLQKEFIL